MKIFIKNRDDKNLAVVVEPGKGGLVFIMHGLGSFKEEPQVRNQALAFHDLGFTVVTFDVANDIGESEGSHDQCTVTRNVDDLEDVIKWANDQEWYEEPFYLSGHSLGGMCILVYAEQHPEKIKGLAPLATPISGKLTYEADQKEMEEWKRAGQRIEISNKKPGVVKRLPWSYMEDNMKYDTTKDAYKLVMPVLMMVGDKDAAHRIEHQRVLYDLLPGDKEFHILKGVPHSVRDEKHLREVKEILTKWVKKVEGI